jgi:hypothetical protein
MNFRKDHLSQFNPPLMQEYDDRELRELVEAGSTA